MGALAALLVLAYVLGLFALAWWSDNHTEASGRHRRALVYGLSLAVYTGSSMYLSGVGLAARSGWIYAAPFLGAGLAASLFFPAMRRVAAIVKRENIVSVADFLASRYGKSRMVGVMVATLSLLCSIPFLAQQLRGMAMQWSIVAHTPNSSVAVLLFAATLAGFVILFGARHAALTETNKGLIRVIATESLVKFIALAAVAGFALAVIIAQPHGLTASDWAGLAQPPRLEGETFSITLLGVAAIFCAPRMFYVGFVHLETLEDLQRGRWWFLLYLLLGVALVVPVVLAGTILFHGQGREMYALLVPQQFGAWASLLTFLGAFSCVAGPVMAETVAMASMISNELVLPLLARAGWRDDPRLDIATAIVRIRRGAICGLLALAWLYAHFMRQNASLSSMGTVTSAGVLQFLPVLVGGLYWRRGHAAGAMAGLCGGFAVWLYAIASPQFFNNFGMVYHFGVRLSATASGDMTAHKIFLSLAVNIALYVAVSLAIRPRLIDRIQAAAFLDVLPTDNRPAGARPRGTVRDVKALVVQFLGAPATERAFARLDKAGRKPLSDKDHADTQLARAAERMLAGAVGASLAHRVMGWHLGDGRWQASDMMRLLDDAAQAVQFNRELLQTTLDHMNQAVYVTDREGALIAWNRRYADMFGFPAGFLQVGRSVREVIRFSLSDTGQGEDKVEAYVNLRMTQIRHGIPHDFERTGADGTVLKILGSPMPGGRYVTTYTDITELKRAAAALQESNEQLELRVSERTRELAAAKGAAERTSHSQARFLAAASHDVLQPLQAARLFIGTALEHSGSQNATVGECMNHADLCIESADRLLRAILNLSRLEVGGLKPEVKPVDVWQLLQELQREFEGEARDKGLSLRIVPARAWVLSDASLLRSVLQNLLSNAIRYTASGGVLVGCRNDAFGMRFEIRDTGPGIAPESQGAIFREFVRLPGGAATGPGAGLGLSIVERVCKLLGHPLQVRSLPGQGSIFSVCVPRAGAPRLDAKASVAHKPRPGLRILYVENEPSVLRGMEGLLASLGADVTTAQCFGEAMAFRGNWDIVLADYHLGDDGNGLDLIEAMAGRASLFALLTANPSEDMVKRAADLNVEIIRKPVSALFLRTFLARAGFVTAVVA